MSHLTSLAVKGCETLHKLQEMLQMGAEGQAHAHLPGPQATLSSKVNMMQPATLVLNMSSHRFA
jgi:hypothetical protein